MTEKLIDAGMRVAIDDAGTGHNGLSAIHALGAKSSELVEMLAALTEKFSMTVVAEGVEMEEQITALLQLGIREGQGYVYSRPVPATTILAMAAKEAAAREPADGSGSLLRSA